jgi:hypothetical protein
MERTTGRRVKKVGLLGVVFLAGVVVGSLGQHGAEAQLGDMMKKAGESGALGPAADLGSAIVEMQDHVTGLQKNIDTLKKVKAALGG